ncbi:transposase [Streptomyces sp. NBC_00435]|uniref:transposase n=1 Tax=Streptomyces sp. NBC_00435 TaxID=2903649 RepID=UPI003FA73E64
MWDLFKRVVPRHPERRQGGGRRRYGDREVLAAIVFVTTSGCSWRQLPPSFGPSGPTAHRRFTEWTRARVWTRLRHLIRREEHARDLRRWEHAVIRALAPRTRSVGRPGRATGQNLRRGLDQMRRTRRTVKHGEPRPAEAREPKRRGCAASPIRGSAPPGRQEGGA